MAPNTFSPWLVEGTIPSIVRGAAGLGSSFKALPEDLRPPRRGPSVLDEIRFTRSVATTAIPLDLRVTIVIGQQALCDNVALDLVARPLDFSLFKTSSLSRVWRFPHPLLLPAGARITVKAALVDPFSAESTAFDLNVAICGRSLPEDFVFPDEIEVPFATSWNVVGATSGVFQSRPSDLRNELRYPLNVERFTALGVVNSAVDDAGAAVNATLQLYGDNGLMGIRDDTPFGTMGFYGRLSWDARSKLAPNSFYIADLGYTLPTGEQGPFAFELAMIGSRKVPAKELGVNL